MVNLQGMYLKLSHIIPCPSKAFLFVKPAGASGSGGNANLYCNAKRPGYTTMIVTQFIWDLLTLKGIKPYFLYYINSYH